MKPNILVQKTSSRCEIARSLVATLFSTLTPQLALAVDRNWSSTPTTGNWSLAVNWGGSIPTTNDVLIFGTSGIVAHNNDLTANLVINGIAFNPGASTFTIAGNAVNLNGSITNSSAVPQSIGIPLGLQVTNVIISGGASISLGGKITSGTLGGLTGATRTVTNNLIAGNLTLGAIELSIDPDSAVRTLTLAGTGNTTLSGVVTNGSSSGTANNKLTFTGTGSLTFDDATGSTYTGSTTINSGTLILDFSNMTTPSNLLGFSNLALGSAVILKGKNATSTSQIFNGITTNANRTSSFAVNQNGANSVDVTLGAMTRSAHSTADFVLPSAGTVTTTSAHTANGIATNSFGTAYQTVGGTTWLAKSGAGPYALSAFPEGSYTTTYAVSNNVDVTTGDSPSGATVSSLRFGGLPGKILTLSGVNTVSTGGVLVTAAATGSIITGGTLRGNSNAGNRELVLINHGSLSVASIIADNGTNTALTVTGVGTTTLSGGNIFTGAVSINQGIVKLGTSQAGVVASPLGVGNAGAPAVTIAQGAVLDLNGFDQTVGTIGTAEGTIRNDGVLPATLTLKNNSIQNGVNVVGSHINLISDVGASNQYQINNSLKTFSGTITQRSGILRSNTFNTDFGTALIVLDIAAAGAIGTNATVGTNNRLLLSGGTGSLPNAIHVASAGFISNNSSSRTLAGEITGFGVLNFIDGSATLTGDCSEFSGTFNLWQTGTSVVINSTLASSSLAKYTFSTEGTTSGTSAYVSNIAGGGTVHMGALSTTGATSNSRLNNNVTNTTATFSVGLLSLDSTFGGIIANGTGTNQITALTKVGGGILTLTANSTYTGATNVDEGSLVILSPRTLSASSVVTVGTSGTIGGTGIFAGPVSVSGTITPGTSVGTLTTGATTLSGTLDVEISGTTADKLVSTGAINLTGATLTVNEIFAGTLPSYVIAQGTSLTGTFAFTNLPAGYSVIYSSTQVILARDGGDAYDSWVNGFPLLVTAADKLPLADFDRDGFSNLMEFVLGGDPTATSQSISPLLSPLTPTQLIFSFKRSDDSESPTSIQTVETSTNLSNWASGVIPPIVIGATNSSGPGYSVMVTENLGLADDVAVSITRGANVQLFVRLKAVK